MLLALCALHLEDHEAGATLGSQRMAVGAGEVQAPFVIALLAQTHSSGFPSTAGTSDLSM